MQQNFLVSIILPTYNREKYIGKAVKSAWEQTYKNIEIIIIDDASTDNTFSVISALSKKDSRIIILRNKINLGLVGALNKGIKKANGKYIARLDDDDSWYGDKKLEKQVDFLEKNKEYALVGGGIIRIGQSGKEILRYLLPEKDQDIRKIILINNMFAHTTVFFRKDIFEKVGGYDKDFDGLEDWDLWLKMGRISKFYNIQEIFASYSRHQYNNPSYLDKNYGRLKQLKLNIKLRKKYRNDYPGYKKAILICWASYFYSFLPFKQKLWPILFRLRVLVTGSLPYKYFK